MKAQMQVFVFDLVPYGEHLEQLKVGDDLPWPLPKEHFKREVAARTYAEHLVAWAEMERLGYDGVAFNEHHTSPYGLMNSPNLMAAAASQRTSRLKLLIYGNLLPMHNPIRLAEELAMLDNLSQGRIISGFVRGIPREYRVFNLPMSESRARFEEAYEMIIGAWTQEVFSFEGQYFSCHDVALWPRPYQQPYPPVWLPTTGSKESIEWAARHNMPITPGALSSGMRDDAIRYYAKCLAQNGHKITPDHLKIDLDVYVADSKEQAVEENGPYRQYFFGTLFSHGNIFAAGSQQNAGYITSAAHDYAQPEHVAAAQRARMELKNLTMDDIRRAAQDMPWGSPDEVTQRIIAEADACGANTILLHLNRGATPHAMFMNQIRRFGQEVLPALHAHTVKDVPLDEALVRA